MSPIRSMLTESGITEQQWRVLRVLLEAGPLDASQVAERASLLQPSLTRIAVTMRDKGLITQVQDASDRRRQMLTITPKGQRIVEDNLEEAREIIGLFKARLGEDNYERLLDLLELLANDLKGSVRGNLVEEGRAGK